MINSVRQARCYLYPAGQKLVNSLTRYTTEITFKFSGKGIAFLIRSSPGGPVRSKEFAPLRRFDARLFLRGYHPPIRPRRSHCLYAVQSVYVCVSSKLYGQLIGNAAHSRIFRC